MKNLAVSELRYRRLFETAQDGILLVDFKTGMIVDVNPFLIDMLGYSKADFLKKYLWEVGVFKDIAASKDNFLTLQKKRYVRFEDLPLETKTGRIVDVEFVANAYQVDGTTVIQCNIRDITDRKKIEHLVARNEAYLRAILDSTDDGILAIDKNGNVIHTNTRFAQFWKIPKKLIKQNNDQILLKYVINQLINPKDFLTKVNKLYKLKATDFDTIRFKDGRVFERYSTSLILNQENEGRVWSFRDITQRLKSEQDLMEAKAKSEAILASIGDAVFACDKQGKILLFNKTAEQMTGILAKNAFGCHYKQIINFIRESDGKPSTDFINEAINNNKITKMTNHVMLLCKDGRQIPVADSAAPIKNDRNEIIGCVVVFHDVTRERQIDKAKTEFVSLASHQLRTPLSTINWYVEMLLSLDVGKLTPKQRQYSQEVYHASQRMVNLVNALLNVSRLELGTFAVEPKVTNIINVAKANLKELLPQILKKKLTVKHKFDKNISVIKADPKLLSIIFQNLLSNSVKYSKRAGEIVFSITKEKDRLLISVADNGIGIPIAQQGQIFNKLFRADNAKKVDPDGSGLGLYIVKEILDYTGGKVWFKTKEEKGTIFYISLPLMGMLKKTGLKKLV